MNAQKTPLTHVDQSDAIETKSCAVGTAITWSVDTAERDWERSLFLVPQRLAEARSRTTGGRGVGGLLLAGVLGFAVLVGDTRGEEASANATAASETQETGVDYWGWLLDWMTGGSNTDNQKSGGSSNDPEGGED